MNLPVDPVRSMEDATLNFEFIEQLGVLGSIIGGNVQVAVGTGSVTFSASTNSATTNVSHGLGRVPVFFAACGTGGANIWFSSPARSATTVSFVGSFYTATTGTFNFVWLAIG